MPESIIKNRLLRVIGYKQIIAMCLALLGCSFYTGYAVAQSPSLDDATLKAVFIERFTRFVDWPEEALSNIPQEKFVLCVFGEDEFLDVASKVYATQKILQHQVIVKTVDLDQVKNCHILYLPFLSQTKLVEVLSQLNGEPVLTIGDTRGYAHRGVQINFFYINDQLRFEINEAAMRKADFQVSYKLLSYAVIVEPFGNENF